MFSSCYVQDTQASSCEWSDDGIQTENQFEVSRPHWPPPTQAMGKIFKGMVKSWPSLSGMSNTV